MIKKIIWIVAAGLVVYLLVVGVPRWIEGERKQEKARNAEMDRQAQQRANQVVGGAAGQQALENATRAMNRSDQESQGNEEQPATPAGDQE